MLEYRGKYNKANVMIDDIDESTKNQIQNILNHPAFQNTYIAIMPDCHKGKGSVIGLTMKLNDYIIPVLIGVDIGCGIESYCLGNIDIDYVQLDRFIRKNIPSGYKVHEKLIVNTCHDAFGNLIYQVCQKTEQDYNRVLRSIGTLGGGNHFIEVDEDPQGRKWLTIHSGSRNFGYQVANYHQNKAKELMKKMFIGDAYKELEFLPINEGGEKYLEDMKIAQKYAEMNRYVMMSKIVGDFFKMRLDNDYIKSIHNYINFKDKIVRKGAISAHEGERMVIPFNMRDGIAICKGKGNSKFNYSAPHGAGRVMSRTRAKELITLEEFKECMEGIYSTSVNKSTLDEAPQAYKDKDLIVRNITETVDIEFFMKPVYNFKAQEKRRRRK